MFSTNNPPSLNLPKGNYSDFCGVLLHFSANFKNSLLFAALKTTDCPDFEPQPFKHIFHFSLTGHDVANISINQPEIRVA